MGKIKIKLHNDEPTDVSKYLEMVEKEDIKNKLFKSDKIKALKARKASRRPGSEVNGNSSN